jgi:YHS domain-containing protein
MSLRTIAAGAFLSLALVVPPVAAPAAAEDPVYTGLFSDLAVSGYDPVAYFTDGKPVEGRGNFEYEWNGATWRFASQSNLAAFEAEPEAYAPQYGGYCAWAVSQGYTASAVPEAWRIVDGKLYLNYSKGVQSKWSQDIPGNIAKANQNWPKVLE